MMSPPSHVASPHRAYIDYWTDRPAPSHAMGGSRLRPPEHGPAAVFEYERNGDLIDETASMSFPPSHREPCYKVGDTIFLQPIRRRLLASTQNWRDMGRSAELGYWIIVALIVKDTDEVIVGYKIRRIAPTTNGQGTIDLARVALTEGRPGHGGTAQLLADGTSGPAVWTREQLDENITEFASAGLVPIYQWVDEHAPDFFTAGMGTAATATEEIARRGVRAILRKALSVTARGLEKGILAALKEYAKQIWPLVRAEAQRRNRPVDAALVGEVAQNNPNAVNAALDKFVETFIDETLGSWIGGAVDRRASRQMKTTLLNHTLFRPFAQIVTTRIAQAGREATFQTWVVQSSNPDDFPDTLMNAWLNQAGEELRGVVVH